MSLPALAWRTETEPRAVPLWHDNDPDYAPAPPLDGDTTADVVVVGAGASGLWAAWALLDADPALDILLIDAGTVAGGASGQGTGACSAWTGALHPHPGGHGTLATALLRDAVVEVGGTAAAEEIECDFRFRGALRVARDPRSLARVRAALDPGADDQSLDPGALGRRVLVPGALGGVSTADCATVHPVRLLRGLAGALESRGARIAEHTRAVRISPGAVVTDQGTVRADRIVQATGAATVPGGVWSPRTVGEVALATVPIEAARWERIGLRRGQLLHVARSGGWPWPVGRTAAVGQGTEPSHAHAHAPAAPDRPARRRLGGVAQPWGALPAEPPDLRAVRTSDDRLVLIGVLPGLGRRPGGTRPAGAYWAGAAVGAVSRRQAGTNATASDPAHRGATARAVRRLRAMSADLFPDLATVPVSHAWSWTRAAADPYPVGVTADGLAWIGGHGPEPLAAANLSGRVLADLLTGSDGALTRAAEHGWA
ncbi:NAD(P)/FAD-dependent oxidoreductase [Cellulomonas denverensis]|uniref:FAD-dependent oxidoreductase n=1 Tax=Cellulomonas denverensis TaxID=264297 RepID=A0A7X6QZ47_9CELL|nr:FAD-dependent oxidoreductase [Cellulomonas denverensis]NKY22823.1 FAD-dependent oxidoreductase [Cellulomonas denverensis]